jgi:hypothetical protein
MLSHLRLVQYDHEVTRSTRNARGTEPPPPSQREKPRGPSPGTSTTKSPDLRHSGAHKGPHEFLVAAGSVEKVRNRNAQSLLMDFCGM